MILKANSGQFWYHSEPSKVSYSTNKKLVKHLLPEGMFKSQYGNPDFFPLANGVYFILIIKKTPLRNEIVKLKKNFFYNYYVSDSKKRVNVVRRK